MIIFLSMLESDAERQVFLALYKQYGDAMLRVARRYFPDDQTSAEDAVQNAWIRVIEKFSRVQEIPCKKQGAYLVVIVKNEAISLLRKRQPEVLLDESIPDTVLASNCDFNSGENDIIEYIHAMPDTYRTVLEMRFIEELSTKEIAALLGLKETTVDVRIHRGRSMLIEKLREGGYV